MTKAQILPMTEQMSDLEIIETFVRQNVGGQPALDAIARLRGHAQTPGLPDMRPLLQFVGWVDSWVSNPVGAYSVNALEGLFRLTRERIAALEAQGPDTSTDRQMNKDRK